MYIGHKRKDGAVQALKDHLENVAALAGEFAGTFDAARHGVRTGLLHDAGKYSPAGQRRMANPEHMPKVDHATAGAKIAIEFRDAFAAFAVAGHHSGLMDAGSAYASMPSDGTLQGRLKKELKGQLDASPFWTEIQPDPKPCFPAWLNPQDVYGQQFYTRMLFSCLVDADFLDTEKFMMEGKPLRNPGERLPCLLEKLRRYVASWLESPEGELNRMRSDVLRRCLMGGDDPRGIYTLTVPTGGGKTVSSLAFALSHAVRHGQNRVIYVIPYTSIIEQNAAVFADILGPDNVLEHHSNANYAEEGEDAEDERTLRRRLASENWDAPVVVTTAVQFFESLYASQTSRCRKLHNIANSVILFDEAQMLPLSELKPCVAAIAELAKHYNSTTVLCTATQPALEDLIAEFAPNHFVRELCPNPEALFRAMRRVNLVREGRMEDAEISGRISEREQVLCVVNTRNRARNLFESLPKEGRYHLSTFMTAEHRSRKLAEIRRRLNAGEICRVVSTSLIEAGVDVDFPEVWREEAGLDSVLQAAGRCNREGKRSAQDSCVHVFSCTGQQLDRIKQNISAMRMTADRCEALDSMQAIRAYFENLRRIRGNSIDKAGILPLCMQMNFRTVGRMFHLIEDDGVTVYIPSEENAAQLNALREGRYDRALLRKLGRSAVSVYREQYRMLLEAGKLELVEREFVILADPENYDSECGLTVHAESGIGLWM